MSSIEDKKKALSLVLEKMDKTYGKGTVMKLGDDSVDDSIEVIPSGSLGLDIALGVGGYPRGRVIEIYGPESSGKTTLTLHAIAEAQKAGGIAAANSCVLIMAFPLNYVEGESPPPAFLYYCSARDRRRSSVSLYRVMAASWLCMSC